MKYTPYSHSRLNCFSQCPEKFKYKYVRKEKVPVIPQKHFEKGRYIHSLMESYPEPLAKQPNFSLSSDQDIKEYNKIVVRFLKDNENVKKLLKNPASNKEQAFYLNDDYDVQSKKKGSLLTGFVDYCVQNGKSGLIIDWKTGKVSKIKKETDDQTKLYALWFFQNFDVEEIECWYYYIDHNEVTKIKYSKDEVQSMVSHFKDKINTIEETTEFELRPSYLCNYCDYQKLCNKEHKA